MTTPPTKSPTSDFVTRLAHWLVVSGIVGAILVVASFLSRPFVSEAMKVAGAPNSNTYESVGFTDPVQVASGVPSSGVVQVRFSGIPKTGAPWTAQWVNTSGARSATGGTVRGVAGSDHTVAVAYGPAKTSTWLTIEIQGFNVPLRVWIK